MADVKPINPMQAFLTGWMHGALHKEGRDCMKIVEVIPMDQPLGFYVLFASGLKLSVKVEVVEESKDV